MKSGITRRLRNLGGISLVVTYCRYTRSCLLFAPGQGGFYSDKIDLVMSLEVPDPSTCIEKLWSAQLIQLNVELLPRCRYRMISRRILGCEGVKLIGLYENLFSPSKSCIYMVWYQLFPFHDHVFLRQ